MKLIPLGVSGAYPKKNMGTSSYLLIGQKTKVMLDFGSGALSRLGEFTDVEHLDAVILTHLHADHCVDMLLLQYYLQLNKLRNFRVYLPNTDCAIGRELASCSAMSLIYIDDHLSCNVGEFDIQYFPMTHPVKTFGVRISDGVRVIAYSGDSTFNDNLFKLADQADLFLCDCSITAQKKSEHSPHMSVEESAEITKRCKTRLCMTHFMLDQQEIVAAAKGTGCEFMTAEELKPIMI